MHERAEVVDNVQMSDNCYMAYIQSFQNKEIGDILKSNLTVLKKRGRGHKSRDFNQKATRLIQLSYFFENYIPLAFI